MYHRFQRIKAQIMLVALGGSTFILGDCDPTIQTTVENGIINLSSTLLQQSIQALILAATSASAA